MPRYATKSHAMMYGTTLSSFKAVVSDKVKKMSPLIRGKFWVLSWSDSLEVSELAWIIWISCKQFPPCRCAFSIRAWCRLIHKLFRLGQLFSPIIRIEGYNLNLLCKFSCESLRLPWFLLKIRRSGLLESWILSCAWGIDLLFSPAWDTVELGEFNGVSSVELGKLTSSVLSWSLTLPSRAR